MKSYNFHLNVFLLLWYKIPPIGGFIFVFLDTMAIHHLLIDVTNIIEEYSTYMKTTLPIWRVLYLYEEYSTYMKSTLPIWRVLYLYEEYSTYMKSILYLYEEYSTYMKSTILQYKLGSKVNVIWSVLPRSSKINN